MGCEEEPLETTLVRLPDASLATDGGVLGIDARARAVSDAGLVSDDTDPDKTAPDKTDSGYGAADAGAPGVRDGAEGSTAPAMTMRELDALAGRVAAHRVPISRPERLKRTFAALGRLEKKRSKRTTNIVVLGDSHIAADYVTRTVRRRLQDRFGDAGRGFVAIDQRVHFGGRRLGRRGFSRARIVDRRGAGQPFGFAGMSITSLRRDAKAFYEIEPGDRLLWVYYEAHPRGPRVRVNLMSERLGRFSTRNRRSQTRRSRVAIPKNAQSDLSPSRPSTDRGQRDPRRLFDEALQVVAEGAGAKLYGLSFETGKPGVLLHSVGPVGADAKVYLTFDRRSLREHLKLVDPQLLVVWLGGNDALAVRQGRRSLATVKDQYRRMLQMFRSLLPNADCMLWAPMDAGERKSTASVDSTGSGSQRDDEIIVSKSKIVEVRDIVREVAEASGCAYWDTFQAMGGEGSFGRWFDEGIMNDDMVHPRELGGELLGHLAATALEDAMVR
ncbi:MAG: hypothetical protein IPK13_06170 [Deltaproteobacteria bacterium]|nr:hypothetical protein [Deltaproteobacteria bacterium]